MSIFEELVQIQITFFQKDTGWNILNQTHFMVNKSSWKKSQNEDLVQNIVQTFLIEFEFDTLMFRNSCLLSLLNNHGLQCVINGKLDTFV